MRIMTSGRATAVCLLIAAAGIGLRAFGSIGQEAPAGEPRVQILSPGDQAYVSGPTLLRAKVEPPNLASSVVFYVDGRQVCALTRLPYECEWDAGTSVDEHQVRVAVNLISGGRVVQTVRTKGVGFAEKVDVDVVQVTVTVLDGHGHFVKGLPRGVFHVSEDGHTQTISHFASEDVPLELIAAVDISGSMAPAIPKLRKAVNEFLGAIPAEDKV